MVESPEGELQDANFVEEPLGAEEVVDDSAAPEKKKTLRKSSSIASREMLDCKLMKIFNNDIK